MTQCTCTINASEGDECVNVIEHKLVRARKEYKCYECGRIIPRKEYYLRETLVWEGFSKHQTCLDCFSLREHVLCDFVFEHVREDIRQEILEGGKTVPEVCMAALTPAAREWICELIETTWEWEEECENS